MIRLAIIFVGGGVGSVLRYAMSGWVYALMGTDFPYGTFAVNVIGSFVIGLFLTISEDRFLVSMDMRALIAIGVLGGFTTFSTFTYETLELFRSGSYFTAAANIVGSIIVALVAAWVGHMVGKLV